MSSYSKASALPASPWLIFDVHGGGFIAQSSKTHCGYLYPLAFETNVPVACVNYDLAPHMQYPTQLHQVTIEPLVWPPLVCAARGTVPGLLRSIFDRYCPHIFGRARTARCWVGRGRTCVL
jgi:hypothetical protein